MPLFKIQPIVYTRVYLFVCVCVCVCVPVRLFVCVHACTYVSVCMGEGVCMLLLLHNLNAHAKHRGEQENHSLQLQYQINTEHTD